MRFDRSNPGDAEVCFEHDERQVMFRYQPETNTYYARRYGKSIAEEKEIGHYNTSLREACDDHNRIIPKELYVSDRTFDAHYMKSSQLIKVVVSTDAEPVEFAEWLSIDYSKITDSGMLVSEKIHNGLKMVVTPTRRGNSLGYDRLPEFARNFPDDALIVQWSLPYDRTVDTQRMAGIVDKLIFDPDTYRYQINVVTRLIKWNRISRGICGINGRPGIEWGDSGITVTTDADMLWSVPGSVLLETMQASGIDYTHIERTVADLELKAGRS